MGFSSGSVNKEPTFNAFDTGDASSTPGLGRSPGEGNGKPLQYSYLKIPWTEEPDGIQSIGLKSWTQLSIHAHMTFIHKQLKGG